MGNKYGELRWKWLAEKGFNTLSDPHQYAYMQSLFAANDVVQAVFCDSKAGTGKTTLAVLAGAYEVESEKYKRIIYVRNAVPVRDMGFLPGTEEEKTAPYMAPLMEALDNVQPGLYEKWAQGERGEPKVHTVTTSYTRGVTWKDAFVIIDEAQSFDLEELRTVLSRITDSCKVVIIGSTAQNDNRKLRKYNGLTPFEVYMRHFSGEMATFHKLEKNYRGWFSQHSDNVDETIERIENK